MAGDVAEGGPVGHGPGWGPYVGRRTLLGGSAALGIASLTLPLSSAAASAGFSIAACTEPTWQTVPWVEQGQTTTVGEIAVFAEVNQSDTNPGHTSENRYMFQDPGFQNVALTFTPVVAGIEMTSLFNTDGGAITETFAVVGKATNGTVLFSQSFVNSDRTEVEPATGAFVPGLARIEVQFTSGDGTASGMQFRLFTC